MSNVEALEHQKKQFNDLILRRGMAQRLYANRDFKKLIMDFFCTEECARYVHTSADPSIGKDSRADALALAQAAGHLRRFLSVVVQMGNAAEHQMEALGEALDEARAEELGENSSDLDGDL